MSTTMVAAIALVLAQVELVYLQFVHLFLHCSSINRRVRDVQELLRLRYMGRSVSDARLPAQAFR